MTNPHAGACYFCAYCHPRALKLAQCRAPLVLPRILDIDACRTDPGQCGPDGRWWAPIGGGVTAATPADLEAAA